MQLRGAHATKKQMQHQLWNDGVYQHPKTFLFCLLVLQQKSEERSIWYCIDCNKNIETQKTQKYVEVRYRASEKAVFVRRRCWWSLILIWWLVTLQIGNWQKRNWYLSVKCLFVFCFCVTKGQPATYNNFHQKQSYEAALRIDCGWF